MNVCGPEVPTAVVTVTGTGPAAWAGVTKVSDVPSPETAVGVIGAPPSTLTRESAVKAEPVSVTAVPPATGPSTGVMPVSVGAASGPAFGPTEAEASSTAVPAWRTPSRPTRRALCVKVPPAVVLLLTRSDTTPVSAVASGVTTVLPRPVRTVFTGARTVASTVLSTGLRTPRSTGTRRPRTLTVAPTPFRLLVSWVTRFCTAVVRAGSSCVVSAVVMYGVRSVPAGRLLRATPCDARAEGTSSVIAPVCRFAVIDPSALVTVVSELPRVVRFGRPVTWTVGPSRRVRVAGIASTVGCRPVRVERRPLIVVARTGLVRLRSRSAIWYAPVWAPFGPAA